MNHEGGPLFWRWFETRVISHITDDHAELKGLREKSTYWKSRFERQTLRLINSEHEDLKLCSLCDAFFMNDEDTELCDCGACYCGNYSDFEICSTFECYRCNTQICSECDTICDECEEPYCSQCVPKNPLCKRQYCSTECKNKNKKIKK